MRNPYGIAGEFLSKWFGTEDTFALLLRHADPPRTRQRIVRCIWIWTRMATGRWLLSERRTMCRRPRLSSALLPANIRSSGACAASLLLSRKQCSKPLPRPSAATAPVLTVRGCFACQDSLIENMLRPAQSLWRVTAFAPSIPRRISGWRCHLLPWLIPAARMCIVRWEAGLNRRTIGRG